MHSPTLALTWQLWGRHRLGLAAVLLYLVATAVVFNLLPAGTLEDRHGGLMSIQFIIALIYVAAVFAHGFESQLEARESGFPARMFTLPVRTVALVGWPMLQGMAVVVLMWLAWAWFVLRPCGIDVSLGSTALLAAALVAVLQALLWSPFGLPWVRVGVAVVVLPLLALAPLLGPAFGLGDSLLIGLYAALVPLAAVAAYVGVSRSRHGAAPDWRALFRWRRPVAGRPSRHRAPFLSPARAQFWFERRRHLLPYPLAVGALTGLYLALLLLLENAPLDRKNQLALGANMAAYPLILAPFFGCFLGRTGTAPGNPYRLSSFTATRPVHGTALVVARMKVAALATLAAWAIVVLAGAAWFVASGSHQWLSQFRDRLFEAYPPWRVGTTALLVGVGLLLVTWRLLVDNLWIGLLGRAWIVRGSLVVCGLVLPAAFMVVGWLGEDPALRRRMWEALPWWGVGVALVKLLLAAVVGRTLVRRRLAEPRALAKILAVWLVAVAGVFVLTWGSVFADEVPAILLVSGSVLSVPLVRLGAAPLALEWNRHR
jgi:hypothetical protein